MSNDESSAMTNLVESVEEASNVLSAPNETSNSNSNSNSNESNVEAEEDLDAPNENGVAAPPPPEPLSAQAQQQLQLVEQLDNQMQGAAPIAVAAQEPVPVPAEEVPVTAPVPMNEVQGVEEHPPAYEQPINAEEARKLSMDCIHKYFTTQFTPLTRHHIESYDQFIERDIKDIIAAQNPIIILKNDASQRNLQVYKYKVKIYVGGESGSEIFIGTPTIALQNGEEVRVLFPNEARLRNLTYAVQVQANIRVEVTILTPVPETQRLKPVTTIIDIPKFHLCNIPLMLQSRYCILHGKPAPLLTEMGECPQDPGGYFIIDGSEKVIVTRQEGAFNTLWITEQDNDPSVSYYASISCLNPKSHEVKRISFFWSREQMRKPKGFGKKSVIYRPSVLEVSIPMVLKPIPIFILFRALGLQTDSDIFQAIFPDFQAPEAQVLADMLTTSVNHAAPFIDTYSAIQYIKSLTKGFSQDHVLDILHEQLFPHVEDRPGARVAFLAECVRKILRVIKRMDPPASRDDTRNQRLLTSGFLCQMHFQNVYKTYVKKMKLKIDETFVYNESMYKDEKFLDIFSEANRREVFVSGAITEGVMRGFKGKWLVGNNKEQSGILQEMSRLSYLDFISTLRHAVLNFDTGMKLQGPRRLHPSQYGYFCTSETPSGKSIGITKNLSIMTAISTGMDPTLFIEWLFNRGTVVSCEFITPELITHMVPVYVNSGLIGYTGFPRLLSRVLRFMKRSGCLPPLSSSTFSIPERKIMIYVDEGRPLRPLIVCEEGGSIGHLPPPARFNRGTWRDLVVGTMLPNVSIGSHTFIDPLKDKSSAKLDDYIAAFEANVDKLGLIEYVDPYEQNEILIANFPEYVLKDTTHMEVHPSTILGLLGNMIPFPNHNQSPRNQLSASQSKQGLSIYTTNWQNRFDNTANILCYGQAPLSRTIYQDYIGDGKMSYGQNIILAMGMFGGYNQEDGIIMNADALARGQFRSINYRSYEMFEEDDPKSRTQIRIGSPKQIPGWNDLKPNNDYSKLDDNGLVRVGEYVDQNTVIVGAYMMNQGGQMKDASKTPQVWTRGRVESVVVTVNNAGLRLVKVRVTQDRVPELGDKFSNRHGQKGTINVLYRATDMPRTADGITPDMIMNPTAIPSRMTIGQILEMICGNVSAELAAYTNVTAFMNDGSPHEMLGNVLEKLGLNRMCNQVLYNGMTGEQIQADIFMGVVYGMRLKHMTEDKWNARGQGRREQRTHQPTGGRGNEGGMKLGEMERDAIVAHGITAFLNESYMMRSDGTTFTLCNGCGTIPIYNERQDLYLCPLCDGRIEYSGTNATDLAPIPPSVRSATSFSKVQYPYATKLFWQEMETFANLGVRILTTRDTVRLKGLEHVQNATNAKGNTLQPLRPLVFEEPEIPTLQNTKPLPTAAEIARELDMLQSQAVQTFQQELQQQAGNTLAGQPTTPLQQQASQIIQGLVANQQPPQPLAGNQYQPVGNQLIQLMPGSTVQPQLQPPMMGPQVENVTDAGMPVINVDTTPATMAAMGLRQPGDATATIQPPPMMAYPPPQPPPRRRARFSPGQQQGGYWQQQPQPYPQPYQQPPAPMNGGGVGGTEEGDGGMPMPQQYAQAVKVEKLG